ncbi:dihydroorotate dehydrogenase electron transfer subunit [Utexia brackfieldae]|uniref:dihydroorotate dehydrogenase electron transfer subunit n=1 Tax=Utexia brackfieldae TaxID=3074108 RepID=UPI00370D2C9F
MTTFDRQSQILSNEWVNEEYKRIIVRVGKEAAQVEPGQFFNLLCPQTAQDKPFFRRPMSTYHADPETGCVEFLYKVVGAGTRTIATLKAGDTLPVLGPLGQGFHLQDNYQHILILGRGVGLATLAPLAEAAAARKLKITVILSARDAKSLMSQHRFIAAKAHLIELTDTDNSSHPDNVARVIRQIQTKNPIDAAFTCGSTRLTKLLQTLAHELQFDGEVALEQQMACGIGMCYCCVKPFRSEDQAPKSKRVCIDGPVFKLSEVIL